MHSGSTLADLVTKAPAAARVLERHHLDYCCGGGQSLRTACTAAGVDLDSVLAEIEALGSVPPADWASLSPTELVDHLESTHHAYLHGELGRLSALAAKVLAVHGGRHPELARVAETYAALRADLEPHLAKEERVLFPLIRGLDAAAAAPAVPRASLANPIRVMLSEHDRAGELLARLRTLTNGFAPPADACASYRALYAALEELEADTHLHVHKENNVLFPAVLGPGDGPATP
jgi:regulator of cell morphogenesis and NO signaling